MFGWEVNNNFFFYALRFMIYVYEMQIKENWQAEGWHETSEKNMIENTCHKANNMLVVGVMIKEGKNSEIEVKFDPKNDFLNDLQILVKLKSVWRSSNSLSFAFSLIATIELWKVKFKGWFQWPSKKTIFGGPIIWRRSENVFYNFLAYFLKLRSRFF